MGWHPRPPVEALPLAGPLWFYVRWFNAPHEAIPLPVFWFNHTVIQTRQGPLVLVIPLRHETGLTTGIPSSEKWAVHWLKSLRAAYGKTAYYEQLSAELEILLREHAGHPLMGLGHKLHGLLGRWLMAEDIPAPRCRWLTKGDTKGSVRGSGASEISGFLFPVDPALSVWHALMHYGREVRLWLLESKSLPLDKNLKGSGVS